MLDAEAHRQAFQRRLDAERSAAERNRMGQFATPEPLAMEIARYAHRLRNGRREPVAFLDPAIGTGSFYSALRRVFPDQEIADACGVELDPRFVDAARNLWRQSGLRLIPGDFTQLAPDRPYNLILTNPPYVRHHHIDGANKIRLKAAVAERCGMAISGLAGLYAHFLLLTDAWMAPGGLALWLIPSEFLDVNYGAILRSYLTEKIKLLHIHRFAPADVQFGDALVTSAIVAFEKAEPPADHRVKLSLGGSIADPIESEEIPLAALRGARKWSGLVGGKAGWTGPSPTLGDFFAIRRGLATGANAFFILDRREARQKGIPEEFLRPILPSSRHLSAAIIEADSDGYPALEKSLAIVDCELPEPVLQRDHPRFWAYLESGKAMGLHEGYLASRRSPWYAQERRDPAPFLCTYMGREKSGAGPFRFFWNRSRAIAANVYLMLYPRGPMEDVLSARPDLYPIVFDHLRSIGGDLLVREGRVYGGGLHKMEPGELARLPAVEMGRVIEEAVATAVRVGGHPPGSAEASGRRSRSGPIGPA